MSHQSTILIVDDEPAGRAALEALLLHQGYQLATAKSGYEALEQAASLHPDVILLDVMMPEMDGFETCRRIRATPGLAEASIILLTALDDRASRLRGIEAGADDFISKPFDRAELRARLRTITSLNRTRRLAAERANFARVIELSPNGILIVDRNETICLANPTMCRLLGVESMAALVCLSARTIVATQDGHALSQELQTIFNNTDHVARIETQLVRFDGSVIPIEADIGGILWNSDAAAQIVVRDISERKEAEKHTQRQLAHLAALRSIDAAITASPDLNLTLGVILDVAVEHLQLDAAAILLRKSHSQMLEYAAMRGLHRSRLLQTEFHIGDGCAGYVAQHRRSLCLPSQQADTVSLRSPFADEFQTYYGVPIIIKGQVEGVLELYHRTLHNPEVHWPHFLETIAGQTAVAIEHATLFQSMQRSHTELAQAYDTTLEGWARALELRDKETEGHSQRVTTMTMQLARYLGVDNAELVHIHRGAVLHDIGKMGVPDSILLKPGPLTEDEWEIMRQHPTMAYDLLAPVTYLRPALDIPYAHHERWDGTGYPRGLKGEEIPLAARIFAVVDVWDALCSDRPYRKGWPEDRVREHIRGLAGTHFDPRVVEAFLNFEAKKQAERRISILVVDDDEDITEVISRTLNDQYMVHVASSGDEALEVLGRESIAVILTDQRMPGLTGVQLLERARHVQPSALGIICSAYFDTAALSDALNLGTVRGFIHKPWTTAELRWRVSEVAQQYNNHTR